MLHKFDLITIIAALLPIVNTEVRGAVSFQILADVLIGALTFKGAVFVSPQAV